MQLPKSCFSLAAAMACLTASAQAVTSFTETFNTNASNWLNGVSEAPTYNTTGGVGDSGYISYNLATHTSGTSGSFDSPPLQLFFRGNTHSTVPANGASGNAFAGNWLADGATVTTMTVSVRHNYSTSLNFYSRIGSGGGAGASLAYDPQFEIAPNTWTTVTIPIMDGNPPFLSYGAGNFTSAFGGVLNVQLGFYLPPSTTFTNLRMDVDNVSVTVVPEPASLGLIALGGLGVLVRRRRSAL